VSAAPDARTLEHAIAKARDQLAGTHEPRKRKRLEGQIHHLSRLLDRAKASERQAVAHG
jgi:hypothetical protein